MKIAIGRTPLQWFATGLTILLFVLLCWNVLQAQTTTMPNRSNIGAAIPTDVPVTPPIAPPSPTAGVVCWTYQQADGIHGGGCSVPIQWGNK